MAETPWNRSLIVMIGSYHVGLGDGSEGALGPPESWSKQPIRQFRLRPKPMA